MYLLCVGDGVLSCLLWRTQDGDAFHLARMTKRGHAPITPGPILHERCRYRAILTRSNECMSTVPHGSHRNEICYGANQADKFVLAVVLIDENDAIDGPYYLRNPFDREPQWGVATMDMKLSEIIERAEKQ